MKKIILILFTLSLYAQPLDLLLNKIEKNNDLSLKTKQEADGISYVITRYQLDMMQVKYLKDVLKNTIISDHSNRYNLLDPFSLPMSPFGNNNIKIYIDNYEISTMSSENGVSLFSDLPLDFVDHIEIYYFSSADKYFGEPTYAIIKLYSKNPKRDNGINTAFSISKKHNSQSIGIGKDNYYIYTSKNAITDNSLNIDNKTVYKNSTTYHVFAKLNHNKNNFMFNSIIDKRDAFLGMSSDGKPDTSYIKNKYFIVGFNRKNTKYKINYTFSYQEDTNNFKETDNPLFKTNNNEDIYSMLTSGDNMTHNFKFDFNIINKEKNKLSLGMLLKHEKNFNIDYTVNDQQIYNGIKSQTKYTYFIDEKYQYLINSILSTSFSYSIYDNDVAKNYYLTNYKIGNTYLFNSKNIFKIFYFHIENAPPNYLINSIFQSKPLIPTTTNSYIFKYKTKLNKTNNLSITFVTGNSKNQIEYVDDSLVNIDKKIKLSFIDFKWNKTYNYINQLSLELFDMIVQNTQLKRMQQIILLNTHKYHKFEFFENLIYKNIKTYHSNNGLDLDLGVKYNKSDNFSISLKAESLLNTRFENEYIRFDPNTNTMLPSVYYPSTPKNIILNMEYSF